jgi:hypothetical protein
MIPRLSAAPHGDSKPKRPRRAHNGWRWDAKLEYDSHGFLQPRRGLIERLWRWVCRRIGKPE